MTVSVKLFDKYKRLWATPEGAIRGVRGTKGVPWSKTSGV